MNPSSVQGILFDISGVLFVGSKPIDGAIEAVAKVKEAGYPCRFITNTSTRSLHSLHRSLSEMGFAIEKDEILSAAQAARIFLRAQKNSTCFLVLAEDVKPDFEEFEQSEESVDYVVVGDIGSAWNYALMNRVFKLLLNGARLIAIHKNRFWQTEDGLQMDLGGFIAALEYAAGQEAMIIGKPSKNFFDMALKDLDLPPSEVAIIGDDIDSDVGGGQGAGLSGILVKTGKFRESDLENSKLAPDCILDSVRDLPAALGLSLT